LATPNSDLFGNSRCYAGDRLAQAHFRWNGSRCEPSRRAERRAGFVRQGSVVTRAVRSTRTGLSQRDKHHQ